MRFSAVMFDLDGTLLDSLADLGESLNAVLGRLGHPPHPIDAYKLMVGNGMETLIRRALPPSVQDPEEVKATVAAMEAEYQTRWKRKTRPYPGIPEMLDDLSARGVPLTILSNKPDPFTQLTVNELLGRWRFARVVGARPGVPKKPDPTQALAIASRLGISPIEFLYLGDSGVDMETAVRAGMYPTGVLWGFRGARELEEHGALSLIAHPADLISLLE